MEKDVEKSFDFSRGVKHFELNSPENSVTMTHDEEVRFFKPLVFLILSS